MRFVLRKTLLRLLASSEAEQTAGSKIKHMGKRRRGVLRQVLAQALSENKDAESIASILKREANTPGKTDQRNWKRVAITERTDARGRASLELIRNAIGRNAKVYRETHDCCDLCASLFGKPGQPKHWLASKVTEKHAGAVHPNCECSPWKAAEMPGLVKAMHQMEEFPMGYVRRERSPEGVWVPMVSTGNGYWVQLDSIMGKHLIRTIVASMPVIEVRRSLGFVVCKHGHIKGRPQGRYALHDLRKLGGARFYPMDLGSRDDQELRVRGMTDVHSFDQYITKIKQVLPAVANMPEYWENPSRIRYLTDFFGFKTLTDWTVVIPGTIPVEAMLGSYAPGRTPVRRAIRRETQRLLREAELKK